jgi:excisionase family DNA binding protein
MPAIEDALRQIVREELDAALARWNPPGTSDDRLVPVAEAAQRLRISESAAWRLVSSGELTSAKVGKYRLVPVAALDAYVARLAGGGTAA